MNVLDLFSGAAGGWSLGLHRAGFTTVAACEIDPWRRERYAENFPHVRMYDDVRTLNAARLRADGVSVDVVAGSPPCQDASSANTKGRGVDGERTGLVFEFVRLVAELRPRWACFENSPRLRTRGIDRVLDELEAIGYTCWPLVVGADDVGAPHIRKRLWLIAADVHRVGAQARGLRSAGPETGAAFALSPANDSHADGQGEPWLPEHEEVERELEQLVGRRGLAWNQTPRPHLRMDDGLSAEVARRQIEAYGDAVLPQITEAIGCAIMRLEHG